MPGAPLGSPAAPAVVGVIIGVAGDVPPVPVPPVPVAESGGWSNAARPLDALQPSAPIAAMVAPKRRIVFTQRQ